MEKLLTNQEFNALLKEMKVEEHDYKRALIKDVPGSIDDALDKLKIYWKLIKPILKVAKLITPPKIDKAIDEFISVVNRLCGETTVEEQSQLLEKFAVVWGIIVPILEAAKGITPPKADAIIDEVLKIGDLLTRS
jgi:hypothetical protein